MCKIIIAEDDKTLRNNFFQFLSDEGYCVFPAENGALAYKLAQENIPDLIISDINMPVMNGYVLMKKLHENPVTASIPIIFITADSEVVVNPESAVGAEALITKPFKIADLLNKIETLIHHK